LGAVWVRRAHVAPAACTPPPAAAAPSRWAFLALAAGAAAGLAGAHGARAGIMTTMSDGGFAEPEDAVGLAERAAGRTLDMAAFRNALLKGEVTRVWFFGVRNETCFFERGDQIGA
jgi:hypothetical protein